MANTTSLPDAFVSTYWSEVKAALLAAGMKPAEADGAIRDFRVHVEPAKWTVYNDEPEEVAEELLDWWKQQPSKVARSLRTRSGLIAALADKTGLSKSETSQLWDALVAQAIRELGPKGPGVFTIPGIGTFRSNGSTRSEEKLVAAIFGKQSDRRLRIQPARELLGQPSSNAAELGANEERWTKHESAVEKRA